MEVETMAITTPEQILKVLRAFNPWWTTGNVMPALLKKYHRFAYHEAMKRLDQKDIRRTIVLTGTRRVGKTTIEYQMIHTLLQKSIAPERIVFISLDHPMLKLSNLNDILDCYHENIWPDQDVYYFFDEIQYAAGWDKWLKTIYDMQPETHCIATGSASPALIRGNADSGAGRWSIIQVSKPIPFVAFQYKHLIRITEFFRQLSFVETVFSIQTTGCNTFFIFFAEG
jgi:predicted AAA+ superfamily ATPase